MLSQSVGNRPTSHRAIRLLTGASKRIVRTIIRPKRIAAAQESHRAAGTARMISICRIANTRLSAYQKGHEWPSRLLTAWQPERALRRKPSKAQDKYSQFIPDQQAGNEKTQEDNQDLQCHTPFLPRATSLWVLG